MEERGFNNLGFCFWEELKRLKLERLLQVFLEMNLNSNVIGYQMDSFRIIKYGANVGYKID